MHEDAIQDMQMSADGSHVITASLDKSAKLVDVQTFEVLKTYKTGRFVQSAAISPIFDHVSAQMHPLAFTWHSFNQSFKVAG